MPMTTGVFVYDLTTAVVTPLTNYVEPAAMLDASAALIVEGCMVGFKAYVVPLD